MKKIISILFVGLIACSAVAQNSALTAGFGLLNAKARVQYEHGFADMHSTGANLGYYFVNWTGPRLEGFYRIYFGGDNERGAFLQVSSGAGSFSFALEDVTTFDYNGNTYEIYEDGGRWMTYGGGLAFGGKVNLNSGFVFESTIGYQFWTRPPSNYSDEYDDFYDLSTTADAVETIGYYVVGPGFPLHFQVKLGFSF